MRVGRFFVCCCLVQLACSNAQPEAGKEPGVPTEPVLAPGAEKALAAAGKETPGLGQKDEAPKEEASPDELKKAPAVDLELLRVRPDSRVRVVELVVKFADLPIGEAVDLVGKLPATVIPGLSYDEATAVKEQFEKLGAKVRLLAGKELRRRLEERGGPRPEEMAPPSRPAVPPARQEAPAVAPAPKPPLDATQHEIPIAGSPRLGAGDAVIIVEFSDFQCPFCSKAGALVKEVRQQLGDGASLVFKHFPLDFHADAELAAQASLAANEQGKFWEMHDLIFANQKALKRDNLEAYAAQIGLDVEGFKAALDSGKYATAVAEDMASGRLVGVRGTPTIFINGRRYQGERTAEAMVKVIREELLK